MITPTQYLEGAMGGHEQALFELDVLTKAATSYKGVPELAYMPFHEAIFKLADSLEHRIRVTQISVEATIMLQAHAKALRAALARFGLYQRG